MRRVVRFQGYDRSMESSFFATVDAVKQIQPNVRSDAIDLLRAFDINRDRIYAIVAKVYARERRGSPTSSTWPMFDIASALLSFTAIDEGIL
jgi:hypothetical protein